MDAEATPEAARNSRAGADGEASTSDTREPAHKKPIVALIIGMAGSGKTTLVQQMNAHMSTNKRTGFLINLDPAVRKLPYEPNIDIRDTVNYKNVMSEYKLGPNGGILTACNLFATRFDQVMQLCEKARDPPLQNIVVDTAGQIEIFTWSASGNIITELFASSMPTVVVYVIDTPRCMNPQTFMSNMMQACSILYKTRLPMVLAFNKVDTVRHDFATAWMQDFEKFQNSLDLDGSYAASLSRSLSLVLDEFYANLRTVGVSSVTGEGMDALFEALEAGAVEYEEFYRVDYEKRKAEVQRKEAERAAEEFNKVQRDIEADRHGTREVLIPGLDNESSA